MCSLIFVLLSTFLLRSRTLSSTQAQIVYETFSLSKDRKFVLFSHLVRPRNTYSGVFRYRLLNTRSAQILTLRIKHPEHNGFVEEFDHAEFGPKGSQVLIAFANNLYYLPSLEGDIIPRHVTSSGKENYIYNGVPDLLYEGEFNEFDLFGYQVGCH